MQNKDKSNLEASLAKLYVINLIAFYIKYPNIYPSDIPGIANVIA
jgi:hypothetical protein